MKYLKTNPKDKQALQNVLVLAFAQAILGAQLPMYFILGGLAGQYLSPNPCLSTLPVTMIIIGSTITAPFLYYMGSLIISVWIEQIKNTLN